MCRIMRTLLNAADHAVRFICGLFLAVMTAIIIVEVFRRYLFGLSFPWTDELVRYMMVATCFIGAPSAYRHGQLAQLELLTDKLRGRMKDFVFIFINAVILIFSIYLVINTFSYAMRPSILNQMSTAMRMPVVIPYMTIPIGFFFMSLYAVEKIVRDIGRMRLGKFEGGEAVS